MPALLRESPPQKLLEPKVIRHLQPSINHYFDFKENEACFDLYDRMRSFISLICERFDETIWQLASDKVGGKSIDDWVSWYVEVIVQVQAVTLEKFSDFIIRQESFNMGISNRLPCDMGRKYLRSLSASYEAAYSEYISLTLIKPRSLKHQRKHKSREWAPYLAEHIPCTCL